MGILPSSIIGDLHITINNGKVMRKHMDSVTETLG